MSVNETEAVQTQSAASEADAVASKPKATRKRAAAASGKASGASRAGKAASSAGAAKADAPSELGAEKGSSSVAADAPAKARRTRTPKQPAEDAAAGTPDAGDVSEKAKKPSRARKKAPAPDAAVAPAGSDAASDSSAASDASADSANAKPARRARKKAEETSGEGASASSFSSDEQLASKGMSSAEEGADKPTGRVRRTRRIVAGSSVLANSSGAQDSSGEDASYSHTGEYAQKAAESDDSHAYDAAQMEAQRDQAQRRQDGQDRRPGSFQRRTSGASQQNKTAAQRAGKGALRQNAGAQSGKQNGAHRQAASQNGQNAQNGRGGHDGNGNRSANNKQRKQHNQPREIVPSVTLDDFVKLKVADLRARAEELSVDATGLKKAELAQAVYEASVKAEGFNEVTGVLDILQDGYGFLRTQGYLPSETDAYVGLATIRRNGLRKGDLVCGQTRPARENEKYAAIQKVISVNGVPAEQCKLRPKFADLTPVYPDDRLLMEHGKNTITARVIDLAAPIGKGQRGLIVSPPKAGKTTILKDIAASISANNPDVYLMCLLVDERPEEVTDMERSVRGEVISSTFDMPCENHIAVAELVIERAKRLVEMGRDVVILMDSITRLARAYNLAQPASGRILSGGVDSTALYPPKRFLGAARNIEGGGSLTILASALIETGSKMDEVIFEEFKGTGNMELRLDRNLADRRIFPAIDPVASGTRKEELLLDPQEAPLIWAVRRILANLNNTERAMDMLIKSLKQTDTNQEFLMRTAKKAQHGKSDGTIEL